MRDELTDQPVGINMPVKIENLDNVIYIHAHFKCIAIKDDGSVWIFDAKERTVEEVKI